MAHFEGLSRTHGLRHPVAVLESRGERGRKNYSLADIFNSSCEAVLLAHGGALHVLLPDAHAQFAHVVRLAEYQRLVSLLPTSVAFVAGVDTGDIANCRYTKSHGQKPKKMTLSERSRPGMKMAAVGTLADSVLPFSEAAAQLLLPCQHNLWRDPVAKAASTRNLPRKPYFESRACFWRGKATGSGSWQALHHLNRSTCSRTKAAEAGLTDRECVVRLAAALSSSKLLDARMGKRAPDVIHGSRVPQCLLAIDGWSYPSILPDAMLQGSLALRVGGWDARGVNAHGWQDRRVSEYSWFEPLLVAGKHYLRTDLDGLPAALEAVSTMRDDAREAVARAGRRAAFALFSPRTVACFTRLSVDEFARRQPAALAAALALKMQGKTRSLCDLQATLSDVKHGHSLGSLRDVSKCPTHGSTKKT
jgi:hypothetical protein